MKNIWKSVLSCVILALMCSLALHAQSSEGSKKEVIIIEKIKDENGNIISKRILRSSNGDLSDEEIEKELEESRHESPFGMNSFDLGNLNFFTPNKDSKPTLGVVLTLKNDQVVINEVTPGSGAEDAELRSNDIILSVDGFVVSSIDDVKSYLKDKSEGDKITLSIIRNDQSFDKEVTLKLNEFSGNNPFGNMSPDFFEGFGKLFDLGNGQMPFNMDSLLNGFNGGQRSLELGIPNYSDREVEEEKPSLGIFIDEIDDGVIIAEVVDDSPADKAKLKVDDRIIEIDGKKIRSFDDLAQIIGAAGKDTKLLITFMRNGKTKEAEVTLQ